MRGSGDKEKDGNYSRGESKNAYIYRQITELIVYEIFLIYFIFLTVKWQSLTDKH